MYNISIVQLRKKDHLCSGISHSRWVMSDSPIKKWAGILEENKQGKGRLRCSLYSLWGWGSVLGVVQNLTSAVDLCVQRIFLKVVDNSAICCVFVYNSSSNYQI